MHTLITCFWHKSPHIQVKLLLNRLKAGRVDSVIVNEQQYLIQQHVRLQIYEICVLVYKETFVLAR